VVVNGYSEKWLKQGFCWVYPAEVLAHPKRLRVGQVVKLASESGEDLGRGLWDNGWIAVRRFRDDVGPVDRSLIAERLRAAQALRDVAVEADTTAYRLVHGENDGLPGIRVDVYGPQLVITLDTPSVRPLLGALVEELNERLTPRGIHLAWRPDPRDNVDTGTLESGLISGHRPPGDVRVTERGMACLVRPGAGKDIGLYSDMRTNRAWLEPFWGGRRVLNLFAHTGMFSVAAAMSGASEVVSVDLSEAYLERAKANFVANNLDPDDHSFLAEDIRKALDRFRRTKDLFDAVILDPPGFSHGSEGRLSAKQDYPRMVAASLRVLEPEGWFIGALNVGTVSPRDFHTAVREGAKKAGRSLQLLFEGGQAPDHPALVEFPEGRYLKFGVWRCVG
jgi:23S rRNA (cytosine1962-C5)-methyltransferase